MNDTSQGFLGVQVTLVGLYLVTFLGDVSFFPVLGLLLGMIGTVVTFAAL